MPRVVVHVMPKPEILDPQGKAVAAALPRLGFEGIASVRQGKRFELEVEGEVTEEVLASLREAAETLLSNPVIEDVVSIEGDGAADGDLRAAYTRGGYEFLDVVVPDHPVLGRRRAQGTFALRSDAGRH